MDDEGDQVFSEKVRPTGTMTAETIHGEPLTSPKLEADFNESRKHPTDTDYSSDDESIEETYSLVLDVSENGN